MPGKSSLSGGKNQPSKKEAEPAGPSFKRILIWPEWSENELATEKFEVGGGGGKGKDKTKISAVSGSLYEDPDGQPFLPLSLSQKVASWKRASEYFNTQDNVATVVATTSEVQQDDLLSANKHLSNNELMSTIISELQSLIFLRSSLPQLITEPDQASSPWQPWHHIYPWPKGLPTPVFNHLGKYCVKLYWMGCWRKVTIDDQLPVDSEDRLLFPVTSTKGELWPALLTKAFLKIFSLEYTNDKETCEEYSVTGLLTGWICETTDINDMEKAWRSIKPNVPQWIRPTEDTTDNNIKTMEGSSRDTIVLGKFLKDSSQLLSTSGLSTCIDIPNYPILLIQWKDEPLELPPKEPPLPTLEAPYYLGLKNRQNRPGTTPPPPIKTDNRSFELLSFDSPDQWIDLDDFVSTFKQIRTYKRPESYEHCHTTSDLSMTAINSGIKKGQSHTQLTTKISDIIFVDSCKPILLTINFSSINCWYESGALIGDVQLTNTTNLTTTTTTATATAEQKQDNIEIVLGSLQVEPYSWRHYNNGCKSIIKMRTAGTNAVTIKLSQGRHVFKLHMSSIFGYHAAVYSDTKFSLVDDEGVLSLLNSPSERFASHCQNVFKTILDIAANVKDPEAVDEQLAQTAMSHSFLNLRARDAHSMRAAMLHTFHILGPKNGLSSSQIFAWKAFINQTMIKFASLSLPDEGKLPIMKYENMKKLKFGGIQGVNVTDDDLKQLTQDMTIDDPSEKKEEAKKEEEEEEKEKKKDKPTSVNQKVNNKSRRNSAAGKSGLRRMSALQGSIEIEKMTHASKQDTLSSNPATDSSKSLAANSTIEETKEEEKEIIKNQLLSSIDTLRPHTNVFGRAIFNSLFVIRPDILNMFPFGTDEHSRAHHKTFTIAPVLSLEPYKWTVLFRNKFTIPLPQDISIRLQSNGLLKKYLIKIINNDTKEEHIVGLPYPLSCSLEPNELGYTLLGEMWTLKEPFEGVDKFTLAIISSTSYLPNLMSLAEEDRLLSDFHTTTIKNYYLPERDYTMLRYAIKVTAECHVTIQLDTSKMDALFRLEVLDGNEVLITSERCGHCVVPSLQLGTNLPSNEEGATNNEHQYIIHVTVLQDTWTISESSWQYISMIKSNEKEDKPSSAKKSKTGRASKTPNTKQNLQQSGSDGIDTSKPHWTLRVITDTESSSNIKVMKDTEKEDFINNTVKAWDVNEPGRSQKAQQARQKFLESHILLKDESGTEEEIASTISVGTGSGAGAGSVPSFGPVTLKPIDLTPFISESNGPPRLMDESYEEKCDQIRKENIDKFRDWMTEIRNKRDEDCEERNELKKIQIQMTRKRQIALNMTRKRLNAPREEMRNTYLEEERKRQELLAAEKAREEAALSSGRDSKRKSPKAKKK